MTHRRPVTLDALEPRRLCAATPAGVYPLGGATPTTLTDADNTVARFSLPGGKGAVTVADDGSWRVSLSQATAASTLTITAKGGNGRITLNEITSTKPAAVDATKATLTGVTTLKNVRALTLATARDLSLTSTTAITTLTAGAWNNPDGQADIITAPSIGTLNVKGAFGADVNLTTKKMALSSATLTGKVTGTWLIAGMAGTLKFSTLRSPSFTIKGNVANLQLTECVAVSKVGTATGGVLHLSKGAVSAANGQDKFQLAPNTTLYTCTADLYSFADLYQYNQPGRQWTYADGTKTVTRTVLASTGTSDGNTTYTVSESAPDNSTEIYSIDSQGRPYLLEVKQFEDSTFRFDDLPIGPRVYRLRSNYRVQSRSTGFSSENNVNSTFGGGSQFVLQLIGHELVTTPAGTFVAVKIISNLTASYSGTLSDGQQSVPLTIGLSSGFTDHLVPGIGLVKQDNFATAAFGANGQTQTTKTANKFVLTKLPTTLPSV